MCFTSLFKLLCDEAVSTVQAEQHQSTKIKTGKTAIPPLSFLTIVLLQTLERQEHGQCCLCCSIAAIGEGAQKLLGELGNSRAGNAGLQLALVLPSITVKKKPRTSPTQNLSACLWKSAGAGQESPLKGDVKRQQRQHKQMKGFRRSQLTSMKSTITNSKHF